MTRPRGLPATRRAGGGLGALDQQQDRAGQEARRAANVPMLVSAALSGFVVPGLA